ncbi:MULTISPECIES: hypothetical protein [Acetobacter]|uniref:Uncharacterized protein n=2 Tax=Acetobacter TaxID=434 RepID=A0AAN1PJP4_9PROT|nr:MULTISPECIES: hypothetical protein [Acetobacter]ASL39303.1 hypothetical protein CBI36_01825 [Acetobacter oryzifermentans]AXN01430.1 hypothetical protein CJF59_13390 [Acetobacter pomorum]KAA8397177.1 hypothetical protein FKW22_05245 [Acetobacter sp. DmW_125124]KAA8397723.1 hypothetical protein FKW20_08675 [Acetobacter sp. DmW_125127]KAA8401126.1 hypothetical protein FKW19_00490 [Acetobacter sp. DmW_125128]
MRAFSFDHLAALAPLNRTAAVVVGRGTGWAPAKKVIHDHDAWQENPLPVITPEGETAQAIAKGLIGTRHGYLTVIGYGGKRSKSKSAKAVWVVRCDCGMYGHHKMRALSNPDKSRMMCPNCDYLHELKAGNVP